MATSGGRTCVWIVSIHFASVHKVKKVHSKTNFHKNEILYHSLTDNLGLIWSSIIIKSLQYINTNTNNMR